MRPHSDTPPLSLTVDGDPAPQGSKTAYRRGKRIVLVEASKRLPAWRDSVRVLAKVRAQTAGHTPVTGAVVLRIVFTMRPPKRLPKTRKYPSVTPDVDKLTRAILDALTGVWYVDDGQVTDLHVIKRYPGQEQASNKPGATISMEEKQ